MKLLNYLNDVSYNKKIEYSDICKNESHRIQKLKRASLSANP